MEINQQSAIDRNAEDLRLARSQREEAEILAEIEAENAIPDISAIDNGYTNIARAFFSASHASKDSNDTRQSAMERENAKQESNSRLQAMVQQVIDRNLEFNQRLMRRIDRSIDRARREMQACEQELSAIRTEKAELAETQLELKEQEKEAVEAVEEKKEELETATVAVEKAVELQEECETDKNSIMCKAGMEEQGLQATPETIQDVVQANVDEKTTARDVAAIEHTAAEEHLQQTKEDVAALDEHAATLEKQENLSQNKLQILSQATTELKTQGARLQALDADVKSGKITEAEATQRRNQIEAEAAEADAAIGGDSFAATNVTTLESRQTGSAASALNDDGGIKASSIQNQFASAASGETPATPDKGLDNDLDRRQSPGQTSTGPNLAMA